MGSRHFVLYPGQAYVELPARPEPGMTVTLKRSDDGPVDVYTTNGEFVIRLENDRVTTVLKNRVPWYVAWISKLFSLNVQNWKVE